VIAIRAFCGKGARPIRGHSAFALRTAFQRNRRTRWVRLPLLPFARLTAPSCQGPGADGYYPMGSQKRSCEAEASCQTSFREGAEIGAPAIPRMEACPNSDKGEVPVPHKCEAELFCPNSAQKA